MLSLLALIYAEIGWAALGIIKKHLRNRSVESVAVISMMGCTAPLHLIGLAGFIMLSGKDMPGGTYFLFLGGWGLTVYTTSFLSIYLSRYQNLLSLSVLIYMLKIIAFALIDHFMFSITASPAKLASTLLAISAAMYLQVQRKELVKDTSRTMALHHIVGITGIIAVIGILNGFFYKSAVTVLDDPFFHAPWAGSLSCSLFLLPGWNKLRHAVRARKVNPWLIAVFVVMVLAGQYAESYGIYYFSLLSITLIVKVSKVMVFTASDLYMRELKPDLKSFLAVLAILTGTILVIIEELNAL